MRLLSKLLVLSVLLLLFGAAYSLRHRKPKPSVLDATSSGSLSEVTRALDLGASPNKEGFKGDTPLLWAVNRRNTAMTQLLLERGADPHRGRFSVVRIAYLNKDGKTLRVLLPHLRKFTPEFSRMRLAAAAGDGKILRQEMKEPGNYKDLQAVTRIAHQWGNDALLEKAVKEQYGSTRWLY